MTTIQGTDGGPRMPGEAIGDRGEEFLRAVARRSRDLVVVLDPDRTVAYVSRPLGPVLGYDDDVPVEQWAGLLDDERRDAIRTALDQAAEVPGTPVPLAMQVCRPEGPDRWFEGDVTDLCHDSSVAGIVIRFLDVSRERLVRQELHKTRYRDPVTGLPNREHFRELVAAAARSAAGRRPVHVVLLDLDDFRRLNDSLGHEWGDRLLVAVAARLAGTLRPGDRLARLGGDEFAVLLDDIPADGSAESVVRRLRLALEQPFLIDGRHLAVSACFGLAAHAGTADELLRDAELAMHHAKATGRGRWTAFRPGMERAAVDLLDLEIDLRHAVSMGALYVAYQPIVHLVRNEVVGVEALARWDRPGHGAVPPDQFIPLAEQLRIIEQLGRSILEQACRDAAAWNTATGVDLGLSVNLSALQLDDPRFVSDVESVLRRTGLRPDLLTLEITESTLMRDVVVTTERLHALRSLGVRIAVDDFGTGYSSLAHLCELPVDVLKIDRSFVAALGDHGRADTLIRVIVDLGRGIGAETVAEGIETPEQAAFLCRLGCPLGQGYLSGRPMAAALVPDFLRITPTRCAPLRASLQKATVS